MNNSTERRSGALRWILALCFLGALATGLMQARLISQLRRDNEALRNVAQNQATEVFDSTASSAASEPEDKTELLRLRNEVRLLRDELAQVKTAPAPPNVARTAAAPLATSATPSQEELSQLALAASQGDFTALDKLAELSAAAARNRTNVNQDTHRELRIAFNMLADQAGKGNENAFEALWRATRMNHLQGMAIYALGQAAGMGNEKALEPLLDPERYLLLRSSATSALKPAADNGNVRAIEALAGVVNDPKGKGLWYMAASGLQKAAIAGNAKAIDALAVLGQAENKSVREVALRALESASFNQHARATEALRGLGYK